jgi:P-type conjugative transfer protein TrbJ
MNCLRLVVAISAMTLAVFAGPKPGAAQLVVFDPNNYAQNVLTAARALQQINNQIASLQNQAQMLINQAKNLATLPFSSLLQLEQSILRTQQLLAQAQRIAYDIQQIDRAFSTTYAPASSNLSDQALIANAQTPPRLTMAHSCFHLPARRLLDVPAAQPEAEDTNCAQTNEPLAHPCPCCGGRMAIIEIF